MVRPNRPLLDWAHTLQDAETCTLEQLREDPSAYLIPDYEFDDEKLVILEGCYDYIFEQELCSWPTDEMNWPQERDPKTFPEWFDVEFHSLVFDLVGTPICVID